MTRQSIYIEGSEKIIKEIIEIARNNLGKEINVVNLMPCIDKQEVIKQLKEIYDSDYPLDELENYIKELEEDLK